MRAVAILLCLFLFLEGRRVRPIQTLGSFDQIVQDPRTGQSTTQHTFLMQATQVDNTAAFVTNNITWVNNSVSEFTFIKVIAYPPNVTFELSIPLMVIPFRSLVQVGQVCTGNNITAFNVPSTAPLPPGTPIPLSDDGKPARFLFRTFDRGRKSVMHAVDQDYARWVQRGRIEENDLHSPHRITRGRVRPIFHTQIGPVGAAAAAVAIGFVIAAVFHNNCWFFSCQDNSGLSALTSRLDDMVGSLARLTATTTMWFNKQQMLNDQITKTLQSQTETNDAILRSQRAMQREIEITQEQLGMLKAALEAVSERGQQQALLMLAQIDDLQIQINQIANALLSITTTTQGQIEQITGWVRTLVRTSRMTQASLMNLRTQSDFKGEVIATFFSILTQTNTSLFQPFLTTSDFRGPNPRLAVEYSAIDSITVQYTFQAEPGEAASPVLAVSQSYTYFCRNDFLLSFPRLGVSFIDLFDFFGPEGCVQNNGINNTCQCYWEIQAQTGAVTRDVDQSIRPFPWGFPLDTELNCQLFATGVPACADQLIASYSDPQNQLKTSQASQYFSIGTYSVMENNASESAITMSESLQNVPTSFFGALRKACFQMVNGNYLNLLSAPSRDWSFSGCGSTVQFQPCYQLIPPIDGVSFRFVYGPDQLNTNIKYSQGGFNLVQRIISDRLRAYWDVTATSGQGGEQCQLTSDNLSFATEDETGIISFFQVFFNVLQSGYNSWVEVVAQGLQSNVTGLMPPDLTWSHSLIPPSGDADSVGCELYQLVQVSPPSIWEFVRQLEMRDTLSSVSIQYFADRAGMQPLTPPQFFSQVTTTIAFPLPTNIILAGPLNSDSPDDSYTYDVGPTDISVSGSYASRAGTVSYLALTVAGWEDALFRNIALESLWLTIWSDIGAGTTFSPIAGGNSLSTFLQPLTNFAPGKPQQCIQKFRLGRGVCSIRDNYSIVSVPNSPIVAFVPYTAYTQTFQISLLTDQIYYVQGNQCPFDLPGLIQFVAPTVALQGQVTVLNPDNFDNVLLYSITSTRPPCGVAFNVPITIAAYSSQRINLGICTSGTVLKLTFARPGAIPVPCAGSLSFEQGQSGVYDPGAQPPNTQSYVFEVRDTIMDAISQTEAVLQNVAVEQYLLTLKPPSQTILNQLHFLANVSVAATFAAARNVTGANCLPNDPRNNCGIDQYFKDWDRAAADFAAAQNATENAQAEAEAAAKKTKESTDAAIKLNYELANITAEINLLNERFQETAKLLQDEIKRFQASQCQGTGCNKGLSTFIIVFVVLIVVAIIAFAIYYFAFKKPKDEARQKEAQEQSNEESDEDGSRSTSSKRGKKGKKTKAIKGGKKSATASLISGVAGNSKGANIASSVISATPQGQAVNLVSGLAFGDRREDVLHSYSINGDKEDEFTVNVEEEIETENEANENETLLSRG